MERINLTFEFGSILKEKYKILLLVALMRAIKIVRNQIQYH